VEAIATLAPQAATHAPKLHTAAGRVEAGLQLLLLLVVVLVVVAILGVWAGLFGGFCVATTRRDHLRRGARC
jgi:hypothetical protein